MILGYDKFILLPDHKTLIVSDLHLGKLTHFRKNGMALPSQPQMKDLERLHAIIDSCLPEHCIFLGDLFHSELNSFWVEFKKFTFSYPDVNFTLIKGNHDIIDESEYTKVRMTLADHLIIDNLLFTHEPTPGTSYYNIYGHIHPGILLTGKGRQHLKLPCFYFGEEEGIMPAFGTFTGLCIVQKRPGHKVFVPVSNEVIEV